MLRSDLRNLVRKQLGETTAAFWSDAELNNWINYAGHDVAAKTLCIHDKGNLTTVTDVAEYALLITFPKLLCPLKIYIDPDWIELTRSTMDELDILFPGWRSSGSSIPDYYIYEPERNKTITLYPAPDSSVAGVDHLMVYYAKDFTDVASDAVDFNSQFLPILELAIVDWVVATGLETRGYGDKANDKWNKYLGRLASYKINLSNQNEPEEIIMKNYRNL